jgi:hypothetical protein
MDSSRTVEDRLRAEYFELLPDIRRTLLETETRVRRDLLDVSLALERTRESSSPIESKNATAP